MMPDRRRTLALSALASLAFWLAVDGFSRIPSFYMPDGFLAPIPGWKRLLIVAVIASVFYATARLIASASPRRWVQRGLWLAALAVMLGGRHALYYEMGSRYTPYGRDEPHLPLRFEQPTLAGTAWWNYTGGDCGYFDREIVVFESESDVVRYRRGAFIGDFLFPVYVLLDVSPYGDRVTRGTVRDSVIHWHSEYETRERISREGDGLRLTWLRDD